MTVLNKRALLGVQNEQPVKLTGSVGISYSLWVNQTGKGLIMTPHLKLKAGQIPPYVLVCGDPARAENYKTFARAMKSWLIIANTALLSVFTR